MSIYKLRRNTPLFYHARIFYSGEQWNKTGFGLTTEYKTTEYKGYKGLGGLQDYRVNVYKVRFIHSSFMQENNETGETVKEIPIKVAEKRKLNLCANVKNYIKPWEDIKFTENTENQKKNEDIEDFNDSGEGFDEFRAYDTHIPTNKIQRGILSIGAAAAAILDPRRHDMVAVLGETTGYESLTMIHKAMMEDSEGKRVLMDKPRINSTTINLTHLSTLPESTLGHHYIKFLEDNKVTPDSRLPVQFVDDPELAYVMQRYREGHDLFHTILGMPTNMLGEVAVKWVEAIQTGLPMCFGAAVFGPLRFRPKQRENYLTLYLPWAIRVGRSSKLLMNVYFEERWEQSIHDIRKEFNIEPFPGHV